MDEHRQCCTHDCNQGRYCSERIATSMHRVYWDALGEARKRGLVTSFVTKDGGHRVSGDDYVRLPAPRDPGESATERTDWIGRALLVAAGVLAFLLTAASVFNVRLPF